MRVTIKGQVTIPQDVREKLGITPHCEVDFFEENSRFYLIKKQTPSTGQMIIEKLTGSATARMSTDKILALTRDDG